MLALRCAAPDPETDDAAAEDECSIVGERLERFRSTGVGRHRLPTAIGNKEGAKVHHEC